MGCPRGRAKRDVPAGGSALVSDSFELLEIAWVDAIGWVDQ